MLAAIQSGARSWRLACLGRRTEDGGTIRTSYISSAARTSRTTVGGGHCWRERRRGTELAAGPPGRSDPALQKEVVEEGNPISGPTQCSRSEKVGRQRERVLGSFGPEGEGGDAAHTGERRHLGNRSEAMVVNSEIG